MTSLEIATIIIPLLARNQIDSENVFLLEQKVREIDYFDSAVLEKVILPGFVKVLDEEITSKSRDEESSCNILRALTIVLSKARITNRMVFKTMVIVITEKLFDPALNESLNQSEFLRAEAFSCMATLTRALTESCVEALYVPDSLGLLGRVGFLCVDSLELLHGNLALKLAALDCLEAVLQVDVEESDVVLRDQISGLIFVMTPKVFGALFKLTLGDANVSERLRRRSLEVLGKILLLIFEETRTQTAEPDISPTDIMNIFTKKSSTERGDVLGSKIKDREERLKYMKETAKSEEWLEAAAAKLTPHLMRISTLLTIPGVSSALVTFCRQLSQKCSQKFQKVLIVFYEILLILDEGINFDSKVLRDGFEIHMKRLPRIVHHDDKKEINVGLKLLNGYLDIFGRNDKAYIENPTFVDSLVTFLVALLEIRAPPNILDESVEFMQVESDFPKIDFEEEIFETLKKPPLSRLVYIAALDQLESNASNEIFLLLAKILPTENENLLEQLLEPIHWDLPITISEASSIEEVKFNIIHICLTVHLSSELPSNDVFFFKILPKILEKAGSPNCLIHATALKALRILAEKRNLTVQELVTQNSDFISHYVALKLRKSNHMESLRILNAFLELNSDFNLIFIQNLLEELISLLSEGFEDDTNTYILKIILIAMRKFEAPVKVEVQTENPLQENLLEKWENLLFPPEQIEVPEEEMVENLERPDEPTEEPEEKEPEESAQNQLIRKIIRNCVDYMVSGHRNHKLYSIDIMTRSLMLLEDNKEFLPMIHLIWGPLSSHFRLQESLLVLNRTFDLLRVMSQRAKSFIQKRTATEVLPFIVRTIKESVKENLDAKEGFASTGTQAQKLQGRIFENMGQIIRDIDVHEKDLDNVLEATLGIFLTEQSKATKEAGLTLVRHLYEYDPTAVIVKFYQQDIKIFE